ncbi:hypothetical protein SAMN02745857_01839 [Andreprevotia lacus DSM 23236]|jgi:hypothetical protein|uniref:DUF6933 domain-containing protein n=1 Tax=Andreprevotia lacus DSM 23236 TaxID=1121001 RepID=A0A1W1XKF6_9NEIS|nr:hypothetical protein [Andreprevotia lacus]SMC24322.1 hypothetical protein SAMN02745857_01839 [Andreprevotia lacus DSM 23236]
MLLFQCTKDACAALTSTRKGVTESWICDHPLPSDDPAWVWQLHAVKIARHPVLVAMHADTRFSMVFWGVKKGDGETLIQLFFERMLNHVAWLARDFALLDASGLKAMADRLIDVHQQCTFRAGGDRSVQTHLNEVVRYCRDAVADNGGLPDNQEQAAGFDAYLNQAPRGARGRPHWFPDDEMLCACLRDFAGVDEAGLLHARERMRTARYRDIEQLLQQS